MSSIKLLKLLPFYIICLSLFYSCGQEKHITGKVLNEANQPVHDATVKIENSTLEVKTDKNGYYSIDYIPGEIVITFLKDGHTSNSLTLKISEKQHYPAKPFVLYTIPEEREVYHLTDEGYQKISRVVVKGRMVEVWNPRFGAKRNIYNLVPQGEPTVIEQGDGIFFDFDPKAKTLFRINKNGSIGQLWASSVGSPVTSWPYFNEVKEANEKISSECLKRQVSLSAGLYVYLRDRKKLSLYLSESDNYFINLCARNG